MKTIALTQDGEETCLQPGDEISVRMGGCTGMCEIKRGDIVIQIDGAELFQTEILAADRIISGIIARLIIVTSLSYKEEMDGGTTRYLVCA